MPPFEFHGLTTISTVILRVRDVKAATEFYERALGMKLRFAFPGFAFFHAGPVNLVLNQPEQAAPVMTAGLTEVVFDVPDIMSAHRALIDRGINFLMEPRMVSADASGELWAAPFRDLDGHLLSLTQRKPKG